MLKTTSQFHFRRTIRSLSKLTVIMVAVLIFCMSFTGCSSSGGKISATVSVLDNRLTDLTKEGVRKAIDEIAEQNPLIGDIKITFSGKEYTFSLKDLSTEYDIDTITDNAFKAGKQSLFGRLFGSDKVIEIPLSIKYDEQQLEITAAEAASFLSREATSFSYEIGTDGVTVTKGGAAASISAADISEKLKENLGKMDFSEIDFEYQASHSEIDFEALKLELDRAPKNPRLNLESDPSGKTVLEGARGITMDIAAAKAAYEASGEADTFFFPVTFTDPTITMSDFSNRLFSDTLSTVTSSFNPSLVGRTTNVKLASSLCNGVILNPGDEFSYNKSVGPRTYERGFKDATVYVSGTTEEGIGGGICQVSSTIYSAALHADMKISERHNHSYMITYVPLGEDATVVYGIKDFKFVNNTDYPIKLKVTYGKSTMTVSIIGTNLSKKTVEMSTKKLSSTPFEIVYKTDTTLPVDTTKVKNNGYTGYVTETYRMVYENGTLVSNTFENKSVYKKLDKVILENPSTPQKSGGYVAPATPVSGDADVQPPLEEPNMPTDETGTNTGTTEGNTPGSGTTDGDTPSQPTEKQDNTQTKP
ncbi:MAG: VanW family protein [Clostridiaceae bacterium]|nr:VanW family protein [Clostridiaceae bacterium]